MDALVLDLVKDGKDINEVLNMPFHFMLELLAEKNKPKQTKSLITAFGG
ncbi:phage tail assembly chaperone GT [Niallia sp. FSL W8-1348]